MALLETYYVSCPEGQIPSQDEWESSQINAEEIALTDAQYITSTEFAIVYEITVRAIKQVVPTYFLEVV